MAVAATSIDDSEQLRAEVQRLRNELAQVRGANNGAAVLTAKSKPREGQWPTVQTFGISGNDDDLADRSALLADPQADFTPQLARFRLDTGSKQNSFDTLYDEEDVIQQIYELPQALQDRIRVAKEELNRVLKEATDSLDTAKPRRLSLRPREPVLARSHSASLLIGADTQDLQKQISDLLKEVRKLRDERDELQRELKRLKELLDYGSKGEPTRDTVASVLRDAVQAQFSDVNGGKVNLSISAQVQKDAVTSVLRDAVCADIVDPNGKKTTLAISAKVQEEKEDTCMQS